jgi:hypothetical protein
MINDKLMSRGLLIFAGFYIAFVTILIAVGA